jgi:LytS/YehU family sensor histidine kinase
LIGIAIWYTVLYSYPENVGFLNTLINHIISASLIIFLEVAILLALNKALFGQVEYTYVSTHLLRWITTSVLFYVAFVLSYYVYLYRTNLEEKKKEEVRLNEMVREAELNLLKSQINPHFLFNSLNSISALTLTDPKKARDMIILLSDFLRYSIARDGKQLSPLSSELQNLERYLAIEKVRFGDRIKFKIDVDEKIQSCTLPVMILQPIIENAIKHGVNESIETVFINLKAYSEEGFLIIEVNNNFDSISPSKKGAGYGLKSIDDRLRLIYHTDGLMKYHKADNSFEVKLFIPQ